VPGSGFDAGALEGYEGPDEGLAAERTDLAWSRSGLAIVAAGILVLRGLPTVTGQPSRPAVGAVLVGLGGVTWGLGWWSAHRRRAGPGRPRPVAAWADLAPAAFGTAAVGLVALGLALVGTR
jgi:uncharacterized membrane protein YidH (DUF202 family)